MRIWFLWLFFKYQDVLPSLSLSQSLPILKLSITVSSILQCFVRPCLFANFKKWKVHLFWCNSYLSWSVTIALHSMHLNMPIIIKNRSNEYLNLVCYFRLFLWSCLYFCWLAMLFFLFLFLVLSLKGTTWIQKLWDLVVCHPLRFRFSFHRLQRLFLLPIIMSSDIHNINLCLGNVMDDILTPCTECRNPHGTVLNGLCPECLKKKLFYED